MAEVSNTSTALEFATTVEVERDFEFQRRARHVRVPFYHYDTERAAAADIARGCSRKDFIDLAMLHVRDHVNAKITYPENAVYVIEVGGRCKIGVSRDPERRAKAIQGSNWDKVRVRALFWTDDEMVYPFETFCHQTASRAGIERRLEWVNASAQEAIMLVAKCAHAWGLRIADSGMWMVHRQFAENEARNFFDWGSFGRLTGRP